MTDDLVDLLRLRHADTWPVQIGKGDLINTDGPAAADRIEKLEAALLDIFDYESRTSLQSFIACTARDALWPKKSVEAQREGQP